MCNVHAGGTIAMMRAAMEGLSEVPGTRPLLIAVTQLTSTSEEALHNELLIPSGMDETIVSYALNTQKALLDGVVCSARESAIVKKACGENFLTITPGIRFADGSKDDQVRITTPAQARENGADYIVVGRPITCATNPVEAYKRCLSEFLNK